MQTLESVLADLYKEGEISFESAISKTSRPDELHRLVGPNPPSVIRKKAIYDPRDQSLVKSRSINS